VVAYTPTEGSPDPDKGRIYVSGICSICYRQVSTRHCQAHWHRFYCHALYEQSLATHPAHLQTKLRLYQTCILSILLYGSETWTLLLEDLRKLEVFHTRSQRMILGIRWHDFVRNIEVVDLAGLPCVRDVIAGRRNSLFGHVVRLDDHTPAHRALSQVAAARTGSRFGPGWRRRPGCPRRSWIQQIGEGTPFSIRAEWSKARRRGHSGLTQRTTDLKINTDWGRG